MTELLFYLISDVEIIDKVEAEPCEAGHTQLCPPLILTRSKYGLGSVTTSDTSIGIQNTIQRLQHINRDNTHTFGKDWDSENVPGIHV